MEYLILSPLFFTLRIIEFLSQLTLTLSILKAKVNILKLILSSILFATLFEIIKLYTPQYLTILVSAALAISILIFILKINYKKAILSYLITILFVGIIDCIVSLTIVKLCNLSTFSNLTQFENLSIIGKCTIVILVFLAALIIKNFHHKKCINTAKDIKSSVSLVTLVVTFFLLAPNFAMILYYHDKKNLPFVIIIINIVAIIATFIINILNTTRGIKLIQIEEELTSEKLYNSTLQHLVDSLRSFKHDYSNTLHTIDGYIFIKDWDGLRNFIDDVVKEAKTITTLDRLNPELFKNPSLFGLVTAKFEYARKSDVNMNFEIYADLENMDIRTYDFTRILGILLDNAIEASAGSEKKVVNFYVVERNAKVTIEISNSFSDTGLKIEDMHKKGASSKGENRGLGLYKVKEIIDRYPNIKLETTMANGMFLQRLIVNKVKLPIS